MSCDVAVAAFLYLAAAGPAAHPAPTPAAISVAGEPLYADIIGKAGRLKTEVEVYRKSGTGPQTRTLPNFDAFKLDIGKLSDLDMQGHLDLAKRGTDGDLKCILRGISQDLPKKLDEVAAAPTWIAQDTALREMWDLLRDNIEVITAPPAPPV